MRKIREYLRLRFEGGLSHRQIAASLQVSRSSVGEYERRFAASGLSWPLPEALSDRDLERRLFPPPPAVPADTRVVPDWAAVHQELRRPGVTLMLLWEEYRAAHPEGFGYSWFCKRYEAWSGSLDVVMRQTHRAGEKLFVDYAGQTVEVVDRASGEIRTAQIFVAVLGASNYTYAEATWTQGLADWIGSHVRAFAYFDGVPAILVPDNLRSGVSKAHRYEPDLNPTYPELANHYGVAVVPARVRKPGRQRQGGDRGADRRALDPGGPAPPKLLQPERAEHGDRRPAGTAQSAVLQEAARFATHGLRDDRSSGTAPAPPDPLRLRDLETGAREHRLSRRGRRPLLLRALHPGEAGPGRAPHRAHGRVLPPPPTHRQPCPLRLEGPSHHRRRAHAQGASRSTPSGPRAPGALGREERTGHRRGHRPHPRQSSASPAGLPLLSGDPASGRALRSRPTGGRLRAGPASERLPLQEYRVDPATRPRPPSPPRTTEPGIYPPPTTTCVVRAISTDRYTSTKESDTYAASPHTGQAPTAASHRHVHRTARAARPARHPHLGLRGAPRPARRPGADRRARIAACRPVCARPSSSTAPAWKTSTTPSRAVWIAASSPNWPPANGSASVSTAWSSARPVSGKRGWRVHWPRRRAARASPPAICAPRACSRSCARPTPTAASPSSCAASPRPICC